MALIRRAKAIANVAEAEKRDAERLRQAERRWGQAITRDGRRYYFDKIERGTVQWECPRELKGTRTRTLRADVVESPPLPDGWRELQKRDRGEDSVLLEHAHRARAVGAAEERGAGGRRRRAPRASARRSPDASVVRRSSARRSIDRVIISSLVDCARVESAESRASSRRRRVARRPRPRFRQMTAKNSSSG